MTASTAKPRDEQRKGNLRLALTLASITVALALGFVVKTWLIGGAA